jgi:hypothetical protein
MRVRTQPLAVKQVMNADAKIVEGDAGEQILTGMAFMMNNLSRRLTAAWHQARSWGFNRPVAGKTGTTNDYKDARACRLRRIFGCSSMTTKASGLSGAQAGYRSGPSSRRAPRRHAGYRLRHRRTRQKGTILKNKCGRDNRDSDGVRRSSSCRRRAVTNFEFQEGRRFVSPT